MTPDELCQRVTIDVPLLADVLGCDQRTARRGIALGQIPSIKVGNKTLIPVAKLLPLLGLDVTSHDDQTSVGLRLVGGISDAT